MRQAPVLNSFPRHGRNTQPDASRGLTAISPLVLYQQLRPGFTSSSSLFIRSLQKAQVYFHPCITDETERQGHTERYLNSSPKLGTYLISLPTKSSVGIVRMCPLYSAAAAVANLQLKNRRF